MTRPNPDPIPRVMQPIPANPNGNMGNVGDIKAARYFSSIYLFIYLFIYIFIFFGL